MTATGGSAGDAPISALNVATYTAFEGGVVIVCVWVPASDHDWNVHGTNAYVCGEDVPMLRCMP